MDEHRGSTSTRRIADAFAELLPEHREVITRAYRGASVTELANALNVSEDIVKSRLHHGLRAFRSALEKNGVTVPWTTGAARGVTPPVRGGTPC